MKRLQLLVLAITGLLLTACMTEPGKAVPLGERPSRSWKLAVGAEPNRVPNSSRLPFEFFNYIPDGHMAAIPTLDGRWMMFWSGVKNFRTLGTGPYPDQMTTVDPPGSVFGGSGNWDGPEQSPEPRYRNGGAWLMSVSRLEDGRLVGFYHAEDHGFPRDPGGMAYKSIWVIYSSDEGVTWTGDAAIVTSYEPRPEAPAWSGAGDFCVVRAGEFWYCFYQEKTEGNSYLCVARSSDPAGAAGWKKLLNGKWTEPGLGGRVSPIANLDAQPGANPSVSFNTYLKRWLIVWHGWDGQSYLASSANLENWDHPRFLVKSEKQNGRAWYPILIGDQGDTVSGQTVRLYYGDVSLVNGLRSFYWVPLVFERKD